MTLYRQLILSDCGGGRNCHNLFSNFSFENHEMTLMRIVGPGNISRLPKQTSSYAVTCVDWLLITRTEQRLGSELASGSSNVRPWLTQFERADDGNCLLNGGANGRYSRMMTYIHVLSLTQHNSCSSIFLNGLLPYFEVLLYYLGMKAALHDNMFTSSSILIWLLIEPKFDPRQEEEFFFVTAPVTVLGSDQSPTYVYWSIFTREYNGLDVKMNTHPYPLPRWSMPGAILPLPHTSSCSCS
jgi:hypothetical protein